MSMVRIQKKPLELLFFLFLCSVAYGQEETKSYQSIDMFVGSSQKAFKSSRVKYAGLWNRMEHDCRGDMPGDWLAAFRNMPNFGQSSFLDLVRGGVKISNQVVYPTEQQFFQNTISAELGRLYACVTGISYRDDVFVLQNVDYFNQLIENLQYLEDELAYGHYVNGLAYSCKVLKSKAQLDSVLASPTNIGCVFTVQGGHALGNYLYIEQGIENTPEYQTLVLNNVDKLKGGLPLRSSSEEHLSIPIFALSFSNFYNDGLVGKTAQFSSQEELLFGKQTGVGNEMTTLGQNVIARLLSKETGRRILVDISGMSPDSRDWYYSYIKDLRYRKDTVPILALNVGISGLNRKDKEYRDKDELVKRQGSLLNNRQGNLARQDLSEIISSGGLIGISFDRHKLMGDAFQKLYDATLPNSYNRRRIALKALVANICRVVQISNQVEAWDAICLSSQFDTHHARPLDVYRSSEDFYELYRELLEFFRNPEDIEDLYTAKQIKKFLYGYTPEEAVDRIFYGNALRMIRQTLPDEAPKKK